MSPSSNPFKVAVTDWLVNLVVLYSTYTLGASLSIQVTVATAVPVLPALSTNSKVNEPFLSKT